MAPPGLPARVSLALTLTQYRSLTGRSHTKTYTAILLLLRRRQRRIYPAHEQRVAIVRVIAREERRTLEAERLVQPPRLGALRVDVKLDLGRWRAAVRPLELGNAAYAEPMPRRRKAAPTASFVISPQPPVREKSK